jgi:hypothetical protein
VQTSTIHPQKILDAKRKHGIPIQGNTHAQEYFVIPVQRLLNDPKIKKMVHWNFPELTKTAMLGLVLNNQHLHGRLGEWNKQDYPVLDQVRGSVCSTACSRVLVFFEQAHLSKHTIMHVWRKDYLDNTFENLTELTPHADEFYRQWGEQFSRGETPQVLTYNGMPHVFIDGEVDIEGLEIIETK